MQNSFFGSRNKLLILDKLGNYVEIKSLAQFWAMVKPLSNNHKKIIESTNFYKELQRRD